MQYEKESVYNGYTGFGELAAVYTSLAAWGDVGHDANGAITSLPAMGGAQSRALGYDKEGRLEQVEQGGQVTKYIYDFRGERVARIEIIGSLRDRVIGPLEEGRA